ncbi:putative heat shock factor like protein [Dictyocoela muelleri]|nr:putative heat shock factor like protein [Dictyocoela muelleri]
MSKRINIDGSQKFILKLYKVVNNPFERYIVWSRSGTCIKINDRLQFTEKSLPQISKARDYSGFVRQLHNYGFIKSKDTNDEEYSHPNFLENRPELLNSIQRNKERTFNNRNKQIDSYVSEISVLKNNIEFLNESNYRLSKEVILLKDRIDRQEKTITGVIDILSNVFRVGIRSDTVNFDKCLVGNSDRSDKYLTDNSRGDLLTDLNEVESNPLLNSTENHQIGIFDKNRKFSNLYLPGNNKTLLEPLQNDKSEIFKKDKSEIFKNDKSENERLHFNKSEREILNHDKSKKEVFKNYENSSSYKNEKFNKSGIDDKKDNWSFFEESGSNFF